MLRRLLDALQSLLPDLNLSLAPGERRRELPAGRRPADGACAEEAAARYLRRRGYRIVCRNRVNAIGELDIVARQGDQIVLVEVRARRPGAPVAPRDSLTRDKRRTLARSGELFLRQHHMSGCRMRVDLVAVELGERGQVCNVEHIRDIELVE